jgi:hypothetical protein
VLLPLLIVGGTASVEPAVVPLVRDGALVCTASVIAPHAVLTAAHCLSDSRPFTVDGRAVIATFVAPGFDPTTLAHDIAIVIVEPTFLLALPYGAASGTTIQLVGFGHTMPGDTMPFAQRTGTATIDEIEAGLIRSSGPARTCEGDSGGPALDAGTIVGVTSSGDCVSVSRHARVDIESTFINTTVLATAAGAGGAGDRCWYDANCAGGAACVPAVDEPRWSFCAPACTTDCPSRLACEDGLCRHPLPSPGAAGASCVKDDECAGEICVAPAGAESQVCTQRCFSDLPGFDCPSGTECRPDDDGSESCFAKADDGGGCSAAPSPAWMLGLLALAQLLRGRGRP